MLVVTYGVAYVLLNYIQWALQRGTDSIRA
jgi:hypothetical protein